MNKDYIYIISNGEGLIKVGVSKNPTKRVKQLQTGNGESLSLLFTEEFECSRKLLLKIENKIHRHLTQICPKKKGEWFSVGTADLEQVKKLIIWHRIRYDQDKVCF